MTRPKPVMLIVLDGWGLREAREANAIALARTPRYDALLHKGKVMRLLTSGEAVGLPDDQMGNSEVGHMNLGAGRIVYQDLTRIDRAIRDGTFCVNPALRKAMAAAREPGARLHLLGLISDGGVHSQLAHVLSLHDLALREGVREVIVHAFLDGRDTPPASGLEYIRTLQAHQDRIGLGRIATVCGRYYAMDRDKRWDRVEKAYRAVVLGEGRKAVSAAAAVEAAYAKGETDEFVLPTVIDPVQIRDGDVAICFNFRADRARELTAALTQSGFAGFSRPAVPQLALFVGMTVYDETWDLPAAFLPQRLTKILPEVLSEAGLRQLRIAETEKYAHVTYFFNGGREEPFPGEERVLIPSPKDVPTYDKKPAMSAREVTAEVLRRIDEEGHDFILLNFANPDMVGHTGVLPAAVEAAEVIDDCLGRIADKVAEKGGVLLITADHGNLEQMVDERGDPHTAHTINPVPLVLLGRDLPLKPEGVLADVAPTILDILGLPRPPEMTAEGLMVKRAATG